MKRKIRHTLIVMCLLGFGGLSLYAYDLLKVEPTTYVAPEKEVITEVVEVEVDPRDAKIEAREAELTEKYENIKRLEAKLDVLLREEEALQAEIQETQKALASFMTGVQ